MDRRRAAALRLPPIDDAGTRDPLFPRRRPRSLTESVDELRAIVLREVFPEINDLRARVAFLESVVLGDQADEAGR